MILLLSWPITALLQAWVLSYLWAWFGVTAGLPPLSMAHLYGLSLLIGYVSKNLNIKDGPEGYEEQLTLVFITILYSFIVLGASFIVATIGGLR